MHTAHDARQRLQYTPHFLYTQEPLVHASLWYVWSLVHTKFLIHSASNTQQGLQCTLVFLLMHTQLLIHTRAFHTHEQFPCIKPIMHPELLIHATCLMHTRPPNTHQWSRYSPALPIYFWASNAHQTVVHTRDVLQTQSFLLAAGPLAHTKASNSHHTSNIQQCL
jgi:hypothetical protein